MNGAVIMGTQTMKRTTRRLLCLFVIGNCALGYGDYNQQMKSSTDLWTQVVHGTANAPEQYRFGVVTAAFWTAQHFHVTLSKAFGAFDLAASLIAVLVLYQVMLGMRAFRDAPLTAKWFGSAAFLALMMYLLEWTAWYRKVGTLPTACAAAVMLWIWSPPANGKPYNKHQVLTAGGFFLLALGLSLVRADVALVVCFGIFITAVTRVSSALALPRVPAILTSAVSGVAVALVQLWLMKVRYPQANYGTVHVWMILHDWYRLSRWAVALLFMTPFIWTLRQVIKRRYAGDGANEAFLIAAIGYVVLWITFGRLDEVRIFLPLAMAVSPLTVELAMLKLVDSPDNHH